MGYLPGYVDREGRTYFKCGECGDSSKPNSCHAFVDLKGKTWCYRCRHKGEISIEAMIQLLLGNISKVEAVHFIPKDSPVKFDGRKTLLTKYEGDNDGDAFAMRKSGGGLIGWHTRFKGKGFLNEGELGIDWKDSQNTPLTSSPKDSIVLVEGPYDVIKENYVAGFGGISYSTIKQLKGHYLWVWPDPDWIDTKDKRRKFVRTLELANQNCTFVQGLIVSDKDPDESKTWNYISLQKAVEYVRNEAG